MSHSHTIAAETRDDTGTGASRRLRRAGKVPGIIYGAGKDPVMLTIGHDAIYHNLEDESFHSSILTVEVDGKGEKAILRDVQMHPFKPFVQHIDFQRVSAKDKIHMNVPLHFTGGEDAPGVKVENGVLSSLMTELDVTCLPADLPEFIEVDVSGLHIGDAIHISELNLPDGVESTTMAHGGDDLAVVTVAAVRGTKADESGAGAEEAEESEEGSEEGGE